MPARIIAIGDIHGCNVALKTLIEAIDPRPDDTIVVLGDVIDWGPDSRDCVRQLIDLSGRCQFILVRGNHEEMLFAALESQSELRYWLNFGGEETLKSYPYRGGDEFIDPEHVRFLKDQARDYYETDEFIFVHACYDPNKPMDRAVEHDAPVGARPAGADASPLLGQDGHRRPHPADERRAAGPGLPEADRHGLLAGGLADCPGGPKRCGDPGQRNG